MRQFRDQDHFLGPDTLRFGRAGNTYAIVGHVGCLGGLLLTVEKVLDACGSQNGEVLVRTVRYSYNLSVVASGNVFRYDNDHERTEHKTRNHKHEFDWRSNQEVGQPRCIGEDWPIMHEVIREAEDWYHANQHLLDAPNRMPSLDELRALDRWPQISFNMTY